MLMSAPSGEDAPRALLAELAPGVLLHAPVLDRATVILFGDADFVAIEQRDAANEIVHRFMWPVREDFSVTDMLTTAARVAHAPLN
jgi:hypothetical protein